MLKLDIDTVNNNFTVEYAIDEIIKQHNTLPLEHRIKKKNDWQNALKPA